MARSEFHPFRPTSLPSRSHDEKSVISVTVGGRRFAYLTGHGAERRAARLYFRNLRLSDFSASVADSCNSFAEQKEAGCSHAFVWLHEDLAELRTVAVHGRLDQWPTAAGSTSRWLINLCWVHNCR
jgi:hypothetical protein